ncbi:MAG: hypothetical protein AAF704_01525 [Cyanobacteria bacterium P01_D01_bin.123]
MNFIRHSLRARLSRGLLIGFTAVGLAALPTGVQAQRITNPSPSQGAQNVDPVSPISASFEALAGVSVKPETVKISVDGQDVTSQSVITKDFFSYRPSAELSPGKHDILLEFTNTNDVPQRVTWSFTVSTPIQAEIESVTHNGANRALAAGEIMLVTVNGTPGSDVTVFLVQDGDRLQTLEAEEVSSGVFVVNVLVEAKDSTQEGIVVARLTNQGQVRFATADQPIQLVTGATAVQQLTTEEGEADATTRRNTPRLRPTVTNYQDGDTVSGSSFAIEGKTAPNASVTIKATSVTSLAGIIGAQQTLANQTVEADDRGRFSITLRPSIVTAGSTYTIELVGQQGERTSPTTTIKLRQE